MSRFGWILRLAVGLGAAQLAAGAARAQAPDSSGWGPPPAFGQPPSPANSWSPTPPDGVLVELHADSPAVRLVRVDGDHETFVCFAPCNQMLPRRAVYRITGDGVVATSKFELPDDRPSLRLDVLAGSQARRTTGLLITVLGAATLLGASVVANNNMNQNVDGTTSTRPSTGVAVAVGVGLTVGIVGLVMLLGTSTEVATSDGVTFAQAPPPGKRPAVRLTMRGLEF